MENIKLKIKDYCKYVEFNAWRFEREELHATLPLLLTIITTLLKKMEVENPEYLKLVTKQNQTFRDKVMRILRGLMFDFTVGVPGFAELGINYDISKTQTEKEDQNLKSRINNFEKTTFQEGIDVINEMLSNLGGSSNNPDLKLVVFIDDLDRCTPEKATEVFESTKIFLNIPGVVFVLALSQEIVEMAIDLKYKEFGDLFSGKDYLRKIIQLPILLPNWESDDIEEFLDFMFKNNNEHGYKTFFVKNKDLIKSAVEPNPRELIRLLNNFIFSYQVYRHDGRIKPEALLALQALKLRWPEYYDEITNDPKILSKVLTLKRSKHE